MEPQVTQFKQFARNHPKLVEEVRNNKRSWKEIYEEWTIFGEDHEIWDPYRSEKIMQGKPKKRNGRSLEGERSSGKQKESSLNLLSLLKNVDFDDLQAYASQIGGALTSVQNFIEEYQKSKSSDQKNQSGPQYSQGQPPGPPGYGPYPPQQNQYPYPH